MEIDSQKMQSLIDHPSESLNIEIKRFIDLDSPKGVGKLITACFAMRNRDGGYIVIGFDNKTLQPFNWDSDVDVESAFHFDTIQAIVSKYASEPFEIKVAFPTRNGQKHPVVIIPQGVRTPVVVKADLKESGNAIVKLGSVYFRTLMANGTVSSSVAKPNDWPEIIQICFNNREADIGGFFRRQLAGISNTTLFSSLAEFLGKAADAKPATLKDRACELLNEGKRRLDVALRERQLNDQEKKVVNAGTSNVALVLDPPTGETTPLKPFLDRMMSANPNLTHWPVWLDSRGFAENSARPKVIGNSFETLILKTDFFSRIDLQILNPKGEFYLGRSLYDDLTDKVQPLTILDPVPTIVFVAEAIAVGISFSKALRNADLNTTLGFAFQWTKLRGRRLSTWGNIGRFMGVGTANDNEVVTFVEVQSDTPLSAIGPYVHEATRDLFARFDGYEMPSAFVEELSRRLVERRLNGF